MPRQVQPAKTRRQLLPKYPVLTRILVCLLLMFLLAPQAVRAQTYTSASTTYSLIDSSSHSKVGYNTTPYKFNAAPGCGTAPPVLDDTLSDPIPIGFSFVFGGVAYSTAQIMSNGRLQLGNTTCGSGTNAIGPPQTYPYGLPDANMSGVMKIFGVDLDPTNLVDQPNYPDATNMTPCQNSSSCYVSVATLATLGSAPSRQFVVTWKSVPEWVGYSNTSGGFDLQILLNEDGSFVYQYGAIVHGGTGTAQIGWQLSTSDYQVLSFGASSEPPAYTAISFHIPAPVASYAFDEGAWATGTAGQVLDSSGFGRPGMSLGNAESTSGGKVCRALDIPANTSGATVDAVKTGVDLSNTALKMQGAGTAMFWYRANTAWNSGNPAQLLDATSVSGEWFFLTRSAAGTLFFEVKDSTGVVRSVETPAQSIAAGTWVHIAIAWDFNGNAGSNQDSLRISINGGAPTVASFTSSGTVSTQIGTVYLGDNALGIADAQGTVNSANGQIDEAQFFNYVLSTAQLLTQMSATRSCATLAFDHLELQHATGMGLTCTPTVLAIRACQNAACSTLYTGGVAGTLKTTGSTSNNFDSSSGYGTGAAFAIPTGSSSTTKGLQVTGVGATLVGVNTVSVTATGTHTCNFGSPSCTVSSADAGFLLEAPNHVAEAASVLSISAVKKSDNSLSCVPAFANVSRAMTLACSYTNPGTGTLPARVGGTALSTAASLGAACGTASQAVTLTFNASGVATPALQYADVGQVTLTASYAGAAGSTEAGLVMTGSTSFIAAPASLAFSGITASPIKAGSPFSATLWARNSANASTPNFGRETPAESATLAWLRVQPTGVAATSGSFSGSLGAFSAGSAGSSNLAWSEVGRGDLLARLTSGSYLGSGFTAFGASPAAGALWCAAEGGNCALPGGTTATVYFGAGASFAARTGAGGTVACNSAVFGDPIPGTVKLCFYVATAATNGSVGDFIAHHFDVSATAACGAFSYAGQAFATQVSARNAAGATTQNFDGSTSTSPNFAQAVTLQDGVPLGLGAMAGAGVAAGAFVSGVAAATPSYAFTTKTTAKQALTVRASNSVSGAGAISSLGYTEASMGLRSGRLRLSNAFGSAGAALQIPVVAEYWTGNAWVLNSADSCSTLASANVALSNPRNDAGNTSTATSTADALTVSNGSGVITLSAPSPANSSLGLDVAINLGSTTSDQSCLANHPGTTGAAKPWLRAQNGACATTADRDPGARASFGIFSPESKKTVHVRDVF